jgi:COG0732: restriction endonuclease S subunits
MKNNRTFLEKLLDGAEVEWKPLKKVCNFISTGKLNANAMDENGIYPFFTCNEKPYKINSYAFDMEAILISGNGSQVGHLNYFKGKFNAYQRTYVIGEFDNNTLVMYLYHYLNFKLRDYITINSKKGSVPYITLPMLEKFEIPIPPLSVQTEIVRILDALTALTSEFTSEFTSELILRQKQYEYYRETLLSPDNLEQLNTGGAKKKLSDVVNIYLGLTYTPTYVENGVKFISAQNTSNDFLDLSNTKFISREEFEKSTSNAKPKRGDILFTRVGSNLGHPVIVDTDEDLCIFVSLGFLRAKDKNILNSYIKHWMNTNLFWKQVEKNVHGSAKVNLNTGWLKNFEIYIPPLKEQQRIVSILDKFETLTHSITEGLPLAIEQSQKRYEYYRELLLNFS